VTEAFLHYIWQFQYFNKHALATSEGEELAVFRTGVYNVHSGPDFSQAVIKIGSLEWVGNVEIHILASEWLLHKHQHDRAYNNVVLHVVWKNDKPILRSDGTTVPTLELQNRIDEKLLLRYRTLAANPAPIPCANSLATIPSITKTSTLDRVLAQRLETKSRLLLSSLRSNNNDWEETFYQALGRNFGFKVNSESFYSVTKALPYKVIAKHIDKPLQTEALLFGIAGFLDEKAEDEYTHLLQREYAMLRAKFGLAATQLHKAQWRFLRLRPANFPTLRLAQFAMLLSTQRALFSQVVAAETIREVKQFFDVVQSAYWQQHYVFGKPSKKMVPGLGQSAVENIIINTVVPTLAAYSMYKDEPLWMDRAVDFLTQLAPENNSIVQQWQALQWNATSAFDSQALVELKNNFCNKRLCLQCNIGVALVRD
jgi:hypothetical protein